LDIFNLVFNILYRIDHWILKLNIQLIDLIIGFYRITRHKLDTEEIKQKMAQCE